MHGLVCASCDECRSDEEADVVQGEHFSQPISEVRAGAGPGWCIAGSKRPYVKTPSDDRAFQSSMKPVTWYERRLEVARGDRLLQRVAIGCRGRAAKLRDAKALRVVEHSSGHEGGQAKAHDEYRRVCDDRLRQRAREGGGAERDCNKKKSAALRFERARLLHRAVWSGRFGPATAGERAGRGGIITR